MTLPNSLRNGPDGQGRFGIHGGRFVAETLMPLILELEQAYEDAKVDPAFHAELQGWFKDYVGRPSPLYLAERLTAELGGARIYFKRDELNHTGAHKINNVLGQMILARRMGRSGSSPRPEPASTGSPRPLWRLGSASSVWSTWASAISSGSSRTCSA